jgi:hypothetical protein
LGRRAVLSIVPDVPALATYHAFDAPKQQEGGRSTLTWPTCLHTTKLDRMSTNHTRPPLSRGGSAESNRGRGSAESSSGRGSAEGRPRRSSSDNPSSRANNYHGFAAMSQNLRPVTHDKVGYPLLCYLNNKDWRAVFPAFALPSDPRNIHPNDDDRHWNGADMLLRSEYENWIQEAQKNGKVPHEKKLTEKIAQGMATALRASPDGTVITEVLHEQSVKTRTPDMSGFVDVIALGSGGSPVLLVEVGLLNDDWWKKLDQGLMYAPGLKNFAAQPIMLVVLTVNVKKGDPLNVDGGRMGVFLVTPRSDFLEEAHYLRKFRMSLLRRVQTNSLAELSEAFGRALRAACLLPGWNSTAAADSGYRYLGPSCCRVPSCSSASEVSE